MKIVLFFMLMAIVSFVRAAPWDVRYQQEDGSGVIHGDWIPNNPTTGQTGLYSFDGSTGGISWVKVGSGLIVASGILSSTATAQVNSDWNAVSGVAQILNKPTVISAFSNDLNFINQSQARSAISLTTTGSGAATYNSTTGVLNVPTPSAPAAQSINDSPGRTLVTTTSSAGFQISATRNALACYEGYIATTSTIGGPASAVVSIETADTNSTTPGDWTIKAQQAYANVIALAVVLNQQQSNNWSLCRMIPAGKYVRIRAGSIVGTASVVLNTTQQETLQ